MKTTLLVTFLGVMVLGPMPEAAAPRDPCALLTTAEVQQGFPGAKPGRPDRSREKLGILHCIWEYPAGTLIVMTSNEPGDTLKEDAEMLTLAFLDPLRGDAAKKVRYETLTGVGDQAVAVVERQDASKGFTQDGAIVVVRRGKQQVSVWSSNLARRERPEALRVLSDLGKAIAKRLN